MTDMGLESRGGQQIRRLLTSDSGYRQYTSYITRASSSFTVYLIAVIVLLIITITTAAHSKGNI